MHNEPRPVPKLDVVCAGAALEMGHAQGTALRARIQSARHELRHLEAFRLEQPRWMPYSCFRALAERKVSRLVTPGVIAAFPEMHARLQGIADGAGISLRSLYLFIGLEALMASVNGRITIPALAAACSAVAIRGRRSADGQPLIGAISITCRSCSRFIRCVKAVRPAECVRWNSSQRRWPARSTA